MTLALSPPFYTFLYIIFIFYTPEVSSLELEMGTLQDVT